MRILVLKEKEDSLGSYESFKFKDKTVDDIINSYKNKLNGVHTILHFKADHFIIDRNPTLNYKKSQKISYDTDIKNPKDIKYDEYDIVWCRDAILDNIVELKNLYPRVLFIYEDVEHCFKNNDNNYDLIIDHDKFDFQLPSSLGVKVSFPYVSSANVLRSHFDLTKKDNHIYFDWRDNQQYTKQLSLSFNDCRERMEKYLDEKYGKKYITGSMKAMNNFGSEKNADTYLEKLSSSKYFVLTFKRLGQALVEAAGMKCIVIGTIQQVNAKYICHPFCLFNEFTPIDKVMAKIHAIEQDTVLQKEILEHQDRLLYTNYITYQENVLVKALEIKRSQ